MGTQFGRRALLAKGSTGGSFAYSLDNYIAAFESVGYGRAASGELEAGLEKVAVYSKPPIGFHAARQLTDGEWVSKLGQSYDIRHVDVSCLTGSAYGEVMAFLARPRHASYSPPA